MAELVVIVLLPGRRAGRRAGGYRTRGKDWLVPPIFGVGRVLQDARYSSPRTILGFLAFIVTILSITMLFAIGMLVGRPPLQYLIPILLIVFVVIVLAILLWVITVGHNNPAMLQLREITGQEYLLIQRATLGDSKAGERVTNVAVPLGDKPASLELPLQKPPEAISEVGDSQPDQEGKDEGSSGDL